MRILLIILTMLFYANTQAQLSSQSYWVLDGDTIYGKWLPYVTVYGGTANTNKGKRAIRKRNKLRKNVYKVYPYVLSTAKMLDEIDSFHQRWGDSRAYEKYKKSVEKELIAKYKPVVKNMTYSQGKIIVLLINRESGRPCYDVIKELRGGMQAVVWQGVAKLFDNNLKRVYEPNGKDRIIEDIVQDIKAGIPY